MDNTIELAVGDRVRVKDENAVKFGLKPGAEGTVRRVGEGDYPTDPLAAALLKGFYTQFPVEVEWDGNDYTEFVYHPKPGLQVWDRVTGDEVERVR